MITFEDGPAGGERIMLHMAPQYLRVVRNRKTLRLDGLDQPGDTPEVGEAVWVYELVKHDGGTFICGRGRGAASGYYPIAKYRYAAAQPPDEVLRNTGQWLAWCAQQPYREGRTT